MKPADDRDGAALRAYYNLGGQLVRRALQRSSALWLEECGSFGLTRIQFAVLTVIGARPDIDQSGVCELSGLDPATVAPVIARLQEAGQLARQRDPQDKRRDNLRLTEAGRALLDAMQAAVQRMDQRLLEPLTARERAVYLRLASKLVGIGNDHHQPSGRASRRRRTGASPGARGDEPETH